MNSPVNISRYIMLKTADALPKEIIHCWFHAAKSFLPNGVLTTIQTTDEQGSLRSVSLVHREVGGEHEYLLPLTRDLTDKEAEPVVDHFASENPDLDFEIEVSSAQTGLLGQSSSVKVDDGKYLELCTSWAKKQHEIWLKDRTDGGWSYGPVMSLKNKTHPLVRPWHELPDQFKKIDTAQPQNLLDLLNDQGYAVISKQELEGLMRLMRGN